MVVATTRRSHEMEACQCGRRERVERRVGENTGIEYERQTKWTRNE